MWYEIRYAAAPRGSAQFYPPLRSLCHARREGASFWVSWNDSHRLCHCRSRRVVSSSTSAPVLGPRENTYLTRGAFRATCDSLVLLKVVKEGGREALQFPARGMDVPLAHVCHNGYDVRATYEAQLASNLFNKLPFRYSIRSDH